MRTLIIPAALAVLLASPWPLLGQQTTTVLKDVEVRSGATEKFYPTMRLKAGDQVTVLSEVKDQPGWLAIKPPATSFSWINAKYVKMVNAREGYVDPDPTNPVEVYAGSSLVNQQPNNWSMKLERGTIVVIVDRALDVGGDKWLPIAPHPSEVRYIPASAVRPTTQVVSTAPANWTLNNPSSPNVVARLTSQSPGSVPPLGPTQPVQAAGTTTSLSPSAPPPLPGAPITTVAPQWSKYGILRATALNADGQPLYRLESATGQPLEYVATPPGKSLRDYVGKVICVYGPTVYRGDSPVRMQYIVASHLNAAN